MFKSISKNVFSRALCIGILIIMWAGAFSRAYSQPPKRPDVPFARGEELVYHAEFNRGLLRGVDVGELQFTAKQLSGNNGGSPNKTIVNLTGDAVTKGLLIRLSGSKFHVHVESLADANPFAVLRTKSFYEDKRTTINSEAIFNHAAGEVIWTASEQNQKPNAKTLPFNGPIHDVLTLIYFVRTQNLKPGQSFDVTMIDAGRTYRCSVNVVAGKKMRTVAGRVNTVRVEPAIFDGTREVRPRGMLTVWLTDDVRHIPVKAQIKAPIGTIDIKLKRVSYRDADIAKN